MKKKIALFLVAASLVAVFSGCSGNKSVSKSSGSQSSASTSSSNTQKTETCLYYVPGTAPVQLNRGTEAINKKLLADGAGVQVQFHYIDWSVWDQKINLALSTGEKFDLFQVMNDRTTLSTYAAKNALADISSYMQQDGANIEKVDPQIMMKSGQVGGKQYAIPAYWVESAIDPQIMLRKDLMKQYGIASTPTTWDELTSDFQTVMKNWKGSQKPYLPLIGNTCFKFGMAQKSYDAWPYVVYNNLFAVYQDGTVKNYFTTPEFKEDCEKAREWYQDGLISPDVLSTTNDQLNNQLSTGNFFVMAGTVGDISSMKAQYPNITVDDFAMLDLAPNKQYVRPYGTRNLNAVPAASEHPDSGVKLYNWVYANQENYDLFFYGQQGVDYTQVGSHNRKDIIDKSSNMSLYNFSDWMGGNLNFERPTLGAPTCVNSLLYNQNKKAVDGYASQFTFDPADCQTKYTDVQTAISSLIPPIACGVKDYNSNIQTILQKLDKAGANDLVAEFQKQLQASKS